MWEDDSRRRKRFVPNSYGCRHFFNNSEYKTSNVEKLENEDKAYEQLLKDLAHKMVLFYLNLF